MEISEVTPSNNQTEEKLNTEPVNKSGTKTGIFDGLNLQMKLLLICSLIFLILLVLIMLTRPRQNVPLQVVPSATPSASVGETPQPRKQSDFSKTEEFSRFEQDLNALQAENKSVDLSETELTFPFLDMNINFIN